MLINGASYQELLWAISFDQPKPRYKSFHWLVPTALNLPLDRDNQFPNVPQNVFVCSRKAAQVGEFSSLALRLVPAISGARHIFCEFL